MKIHVYICNALFILLFCLVFPLSASENYQLELKNGKLIAFRTMTKVGEKALRVVTEDGKSLTVLREQLSESEIIRRFGSLFPRRYGKAYRVKSKLSPNFNSSKFMDSIKVRYDSMELLEKKMRYSDKKVKYYLFKPDKRNIKTGEKVPLVIFFHGKDDRHHMNRHPQCLIFVQPEIQKKYPCYFIAPILPDGKFVNWNGSDTRNRYRCTMAMECVFRIIDELEKRYSNLDGDRIYVTGLSSGGIACWNAIMKYPERFAGAVPIAGVRGNQNMASHGASPQVSWGGFFV